MTTLSSPGQRTASRLGVTVGFGLVAVAEVLAGVSVAAALAVLLGCVALAGIWSGGNLPMLAFVASITAWAGLVSDRSWWVILGAAGLVLAHVWLLVEEQTSRTAVVPRDAILRLLVRGGGVVAAAGAVAVVAHLQRHGSSAAHAGLGVLTLLLLTIWLTSPQLARATRTSPRAGRGGRHAR